MTIKIDDPLVQDANYRFTPADRRKIDDQIILLQNELTAVAATIPAGDELDVDTFDWMPLTNGPSQSFNKTIDTVSVTPATLLTVAIPDESTGDYNATVIGRSDNGKHFRLDLRAGWERTGGTVTVIDAPATADALSTSNAAGWSAVFAQSGTNAVITVVGEAATARTRWTVLASAQLSKLTSSGGGGGGGTIAGLALTGRWTTAYAASPWVGVASAGSSGTNNLTEATNPPATGPALNGRTPALFNGTNSKLTAATDAGTMLSAGAWSFWCLFKANTIAGVQSVYGANNESLGGAAVTQTWVASLTDLDPGGAHDYRAQIGQIQLDSSPVINNLAITLGTYHLLQGKYDGTNVRARVDSGSWVDVASTHNVGISGAYTIGPSVNGALVDFDGDIADTGVAAVAFSDGDFDAIKAELNTLHGLAL